MEIFINGRFLSQALTGVQRYAAEMVVAMDRLLAAGKAERHIQEANWTLLIPANSTVDLALKHIAVRKVGSRSGHAWDQIDLARAARGGYLISLANSGPVLHFNQLVVIHDAQVFRRPDFFGFRYSAVHRVLGYLLARTATIATVSNFSQRELSDVLGLAATAILVFPNSAEHFAKTTPDFEILNRLDIQTSRFFLCVGSMTKNKNISLAIEAARRLGKPRVPIVIVGGNNSKVFQQIDAAEDKNVIFAGRLTDEEIAALYARAAAFIFPSLYEGFGVPPLEAMIFSCPVIASTAGAVVETCGDAAVYFDPNNISELQNLMAERMRSGPISDEEKHRQKTRIEFFSWPNSASQMLKFLAQRQLQKK